jgi:uncharacterized protein YyaL (SSP411 family)
MSKNLLYKETSPYLLQHKDNPVHWYPWGQKAFAKAKTENKPVLLSIGYAACHWCHVMAHESFENDDTADLMNKHFINIKVDREEFPDVDKLYMDAVHAFGERGGWPLTMFLEPDGTPFWGGTYFPDKPLYGRPSFTQVLTSLSLTWKNHPEKISANKDAILKALQDTPQKTSHNVQITEELLMATANQIASKTDHTNGGLTGAPKFPQTMVFEFLWRMFLKTGNEEYRTPVITTLTHICQGGIYDHLAGGFARYSVDERWLAPHFEKMLYDNALILDLLIQVNHTENDVLFRQRIEETIIWLTSQMMTGEGAFAASYDADSEGKEGTFYVWSYQQVVQVIPETNQKEFCEAYDISPQGNWEGKNILNRLHSLKLRDSTCEHRLEQCRNQLLKIRNQRPWPGWDDKALSDWNGLTIAMLCHASFALDRKEWIEQAETAYAAVKQHLWKPTGLQHAFRAGKTTNAGTSDDYANFIKAALSLFEATGKKHYLKDAEKLASEIDRFHWNNKTGGYHFASANSALLLARSCFAHDDATPNANGTMLTNLAKLFHHTGNNHYDQRARQLLSTFTANVVSAPMAYCGFLRGYLDLSEHVHAVVALPEQTELAQDYARLLQTTPRPVTVSLLSPGQVLPVSHPASGKPAINGKTTIYLCHGQTCGKPATSLDELKKQISNI